MSYEYVQKSRTNRKLDMVYVMGGYCQCCGYHRDVHALEFHHINPAEKDFSFNKAESIGWETIRNELSKCILVCANCHREIHSGFITEKLHTSFIEERADEVSTRIDGLKHHTLHYCKNCGKIISNKAKYCVDCFAKNREKVEHPTREQLKDLIRTTPFTVIAKYYGVSDNAIRKWCKKENLPSKASEIKNISDEDWSRI